MQATPGNHCEKSAHALPLLLGRIHVCSHVSKTAHPRELPSFSKGDYGDQKLLVAHQGPFYYQQVPSSTAGVPGQVLTKEGSVSTWELAL